MKSIRNFSIIAHIDHGKSTLSDRIIQICGGLSNRKIKAQVLDSMEIERERGITIKAQSVTLYYTALDGKKYQLNFIDTPGHVDFSYEVSRSLAASEGVLLVVDTSQGVEAQTIANCYSAIEMDLEIIVVLNKIDLPTAHPDRTKQEIEDIIGINTSNAVYCSAKTGEGIPVLLEQLINSIPPPQGNPMSPLQALIIDSWFNNYLGIVALIRIKNGTLYTGKKIKVMSTGQVYNVDRLGIFTPRRCDLTKLECGEIGWLVCSIKHVCGILVGDTITEAYNPANTALPGFKKIKPSVYFGLFPVNSNDYEAFRNALSKLSLNDASLFYEPESSNILGSGFRCGFLGLLHAEIIQERLEREYGLELVITLPTVMYEIHLKNEEVIYIHNPSMLPPAYKIKELREPVAACNILVPQKYLGKVISLCEQKRGKQKNIIYHGNHVDVTYDIPMKEIIVDFLSCLKSISHGHASLEYSFKHFQISNLVRVDIAINKKHVDTLSFIAHKDDALYQSRNLVENMKKFIPRQQFDVIIQASIDSNIIIRSVVKQLRKNVTEKCYGGDVSRKKKLLNKQKEGKKRMKRIGNVKITQEVLVSALHTINRNNKQP